MKIIVAGSRNIQDYQKVLNAIQESGFAITEVVSGGAYGVDRLGEQFAKEHNLPIKRFLPNWQKFGRKAGILRNKEMGDYAQGLIAIWDGESKGTKFMIDYAKQKGLKVFISVEYPLFA